MQTKIHRSQVIIISDNCQLNTVTMPLPRVSEWLGKRGFFTHVTYCAFALWWKCLHSIVGRRSKQCVRTNNSKTSSKSCACINKIIFSINFMHNTFSKIVILIFFTTIFRPRKSTYVKNGGKQVYTNQDSFVYCNFYLWWRSVKACALISILV